MSEMRVVGVRVELPANQPILLLRETDGERYLPIWIGSVEATAIALEQQGVRPARPLTHDLLKDVIGALGRELEQVRITDLREGTFFAELVFDSGGDAPYKFTTQVHVVPDVLSHSFDEFRKSIK